MNAMSYFAAVAAGLAALTLAPAELAAQVTTRTISCGSTENVRNECSADGAVSTVRLVRRIGIYRCDQGRSWGYTSRSIWTSDRCRGEFEVTYRGISPLPGKPVPVPVRPTPPAVTRVMNCGDNSGDQRQCRTEGYATSVRLVRNRGQSRCVQGSNWGHTDSFIWTNRGCMGVFEVTYRETAGPGPAPATRVISCGSMSGDNSCNPRGRVARVRLVREAPIARGRCRQGSTWGYTIDDVWTRAGCQGDFEITYEATAAPGTRIITCGSASGNNSCNPFGQVASVRLVRELSRNRCRQGVTWGYRADVVWTRDGCRGEFEVRHAAGGGMK